MLLRTIETVEPPQSRILIPWLVSGLNGSAFERLEPRTSNSSMFGVHNKGKICGKAGVQRSSEARP